MTDDPSDETPPASAASATTASATAAPHAKAPAWTHAAAVVAALAATVGIFWWIGSMEFPDAPVGDAAVVGAPTEAPAAAIALTEPRRNELLIFSKTAGFRHDSIPEGIVAVTAIGESLGLTATATEDAAFFTPEHLAPCAAVVFLNTTGDVLDDTQQKAFEDYIATGGSYIGIHSAADTEYDWAFYGQLVGAYFQKHPRIQEATVEIKVADHPATRGIDRFWKRTDEWYDYRAAPRVGVTVLAALDESSYEGGSMFGNHPTAWCHELPRRAAGASAGSAADEGTGGTGGTGSTGGTGGTRTSPGAPARAIYTGGGHTKESYSEPAFLKHLTGSIAWATRREVPADGPVAGSGSTAPSE